MPAEDPHDLIRLDAAANSFQAHIWQQALEQKGIYCRVLGDYLEGGIGDISGMMPEIWVEAADATRAANDVRMTKGSGRLCPSFFQDIP